MFAPSPQTDMGMRIDGAMFCGTLSSVVLIALALTVQ